MEETPLLLGLFQMVEALVALPNGYQEQQEEVEEEEVKIASTTLIVILVLEEALGIRRLLYPHRVLMVVMEVVII
jgi:hypothetical protein